MKAIYNARIFDGQQIRDGMAVTFREGRIVDLLPETGIPPGVEKVDLQGKYMAPALIDLQIYGAGDRLFSQKTDADTLAATYGYCLAGGATQFMITLATNTMEVFHKGIQAVRDYWHQGGRGLMGLHLEGPYINPEKRGAHLRELVKTATVAEIRELLDLGKGVIKIMTLAPECCSPECITLLQENGVLVSAGHSNATYAEASRAFAAGINVCTHLFNAMSPLQHRSPGLVGAILDHPAVMSSIVPDGIHVDYAAARIAKRLLQDRLFIITDAVARNSEGIYRHELRGDRYTLPDGTLSGSALTMLQGVRNCVEHLQVPLEEALRMASLYPARAMGKAFERGKILPGYLAELIAFDENFQSLEIIA
jgi:N-acetylglucosamine-6-phosphate deacetylase